MYLILGLGKSGLSCARYCLARGIPFAVNDSRQHPPDEAELNKIAPQVKRVFGGFSRELISQASQLIVSPGVSLLEPLIVEAVKQGIPAVGDTELFVREAKAPIVAITGSNAKSTVTALVGQMVEQAGKKVAVGGNIGVPVLDVLSDEVEVYVIEFSSFQLERTPSIKAHVATVLNISEDHMDRYVDMREYLRAKKRIYHNCQFAVINRHEPQTWPNEKFTANISFGLNKSKQGEFGILHADQGDYLAFGQEQLMPVSDLKIQGEHNIINALSALAIGCALELPMQAMLKALKNFSGLAHRCQFVSEHAGVKWYDDSKATNVGATKAALEGLGSQIKGKIVLIAGGISKGADFLPLKPVMKKYVRQLILIGDAAKQMAMTFQGVVPVKQVKSLPAAVEYADFVAVRGDIVLLSPACSSFDMFRDYVHRGEEFIKLVQCF